MISPARFEVELHVNQEDIDRGVVAKCNACPIYNGLVRAIAGHVVFKRHKPKVGVWMIELEPGYVCLTPDDVLQKQWHYDHTTEMEPFTTKLTFRRLPKPRRKQV